MVSKVRQFLHFSFENCVSQYQFCMLRGVSNNEMEDVQSKPILNAPREYYRHNKKTRG